MAIVTVSDVLLFGGGVWLALSVVALAVLLAIHAAERKDAAKRSEGLEQDGATLAPAAGAAALDPS